MSQTTNRIWVCRNEKPSDDYDTAMYVMLFASGAAKNEFGDWVPENGDNEGWEERYEIWPHIWEIVHPMNIAKIQLAPGEGPIEIEIRRKA